ncbi:MAG: hypothetical protein QXJ74_10770 [Nitrososphaera sp.]|nr:hypothetical protein [Nitrososphaera sp.]
MPVFQCVSCEVQFGSREDFDKHARESGHYVVEVFSDYEEAVAIG